MYRKLLLLVVAAMIVLAGCSGTGPGPTATGPTASGPSDSTATPDDTQSDGTDGSGQAGTVALYISDEPNDIGDFKHLNATVTEVQFHYVGSTNDSAGNTTTPSTVTATAAPTTVVTTTEAAEQKGQGEAKGEKGKEKKGGEEPESKDGSEKGQARWITKDINDTTVDLTQLQGANATLLENLSMPAGKYTQVRLVVSQVNGTLTDGSDQRVKLPSQRLKLNKPFTVGPNKSVNFVFDITIHKAGKSGKYILKPVAGESGTDQEIERVEAKANREVKGN